MPFQPDAAASSSGSSTLQYPPWAYPQGQTYGNGAPRAPRTPFNAIMGGQISAADHPFVPAGLGQQDFGSVQQWNTLAPSEQQGQIGYYQDALGVHAPDVQDLMKKLAPQGFGSAVPKWATTESY